MLCALPITGTFLTSRLSHAVQLSLAKVPPSVLTVVIFIVLFRVTLTLALALAITLILILVLELSILFAVGFAAFCSTIVMDDEFKYLVECNTSPVRDPRAFGIWGPDLALAAGCAATILP